jgi:hypothetical protein
MPRRDETSAAAIKLFWGRQGRSRDVFSLQLKQFVTLILASTSAEVVRTPNSCMEVPGSCPDQIIILRVDVILLSIFTQIRNRSLKYTPA